MIVTTTRAALFCSVAPVIAGLSAPATAQTVLDVDSDTALRTSDDGDITLEEDVELDVTGETPVVIDSDNIVTLKTGSKISGDDADNRIGVEFGSGTNGSLIIGEDVAAGIYMREDFVPDDGNNDDIADGEIALAINRVGILVNSTTATIDIGAEGTVYVEGLNSAGIRLGDDWAGTYSNLGTITVIGDNSVGLDTGSIVGDFKVSGTIDAIGEGAQVLTIGGDIGGRLIIDGELTKDRSFTNDENDTMTLSRAALRDDNPAVAIAGSVAGGILLDAPPLELDDDDEDEDDDGVTDADEPVGRITSYGEGAALEIAGSDDITIGTAATRDGTFSLGLDGTVRSFGQYSGLDSTALVIGGRGGEVDLVGGISIGGSLEATTRDSDAVALLINEGASVPELYISGEIEALVNSDGQGSATAVRDLSGSLTTITNTGSVAALDGADGANIAFDLGDNTVGVTLNQVLNDVDAEAYEDELADENYDPDDPTIYASITGDIVTGSGDDMLNFETGEILGDSMLGAGSDSVMLSENARYVGDINSGTGNFAMTLSGISRFTGRLFLNDASAALTIDDDAVFSGDVVDGDALTVTVNGGLLQASDNDDPVRFDTLDVGADGAIGIIIDSDGETSTEFEVRTATFADGAGINLEVDDLVNAEGEYVVLTADTLSIDGELELDGLDAPIIYRPEIETTDTQIHVNLGRKTAEELGLSTPAAAIYDIALDALDADGNVQASLLSAVDEAAFGAQLGYLLPDYNGGVFDFVAESSRVASRRLARRDPTFKEWPVTIWLDGISFGGSRTDADSADYSHDGLGLSAGWERRVGNAYVGLTGSFATGSVDTGDHQVTDITKYEIGAHARYWTGPLYVFARGGYFLADMDGTNSFFGDMGAEGEADDFTRTSVAQWDGDGFTGMIGASYEWQASERLALRPTVTADYFRLKEKAYATDSENSPDLNLEISERESDLASVTPSLVVAYQLEEGRDLEHPVKVELEGGYRTIVSGAAGDTTARFANSDSFTVTPASLSGGWMAEARLSAGGWYHLLEVSAGAQQMGGDIVYSLRASFSLAI